MTALLHRESSTWGEVAKIIVVVGGVATIVFGTAALTRDSTKETTVSSVTTATLAKRVDSLTEREASDRNVVNGRIDHYVALTQQSVEGLRTDVTHEMSGIREDLAKMQNQLAEIRDRIPTAKPTGLRAAEPVRAETRTN